MEMFLRRTYGNFLEGRPNRRVNDRIVSRLPDKARRIFPGPPVWVVPPRPIREKDAEILQPYICIGSFLSTPVDPRLDDVLNLSTLVVVWFQEDTDIPEGWEAPVDLLDVIWEDHARDGEI